MNAKRGTAIDSFIATRVRALRTKARMSQASLGSQLGLTFQQVQKYEKGVNRIGAGRLFEMARILNVPIEALYPHTAATDSPPHSEDLSDIFLTADGLRLCRAFLRISVPAQRKRIIALVEAMAEEQESAT